MPKHEPTYVHVKGRVVLTCTCGHVRRYENEGKARQGFGTHASSKRRKEEVAEQE